MSIGRAGPTYIVQPNARASKGIRFTFNMDVPAGADVADAASIVNWFKLFAVHFAVAPLDD